ncbi:hypothetical protein HD554DRAFT_2036314 [Boletus coccyginus]|nr:hypothetical protein HD554DRAFT_2036314 [Boletus coccyginus]
MQAAISLWSSRLRAHPMVPGHNLRRNMAGWGRKHVMHSSAFLASWILETGVTVRKPLPWRGVWPYTILAPCRFFLDLRTHSIPSHDTVRGVQSKHENHKLENDSCRSTRESMAPIQSRVRAGGGVKTARLVLKEESGDDVQNANTSLVYLLEKNTVLRERSLVFPPRGGFGWAGSSQPQRNRHRETAQKIREAVYEPDATKCTPDNPASDPSRGLLNETERLCARRGITPS